MPKPVLLLFLLSLCILACKRDQAIRVRFQLSDATFEQLKGKKLYLFHGKTRLLKDSLVVVTPENSFTVAADTNTLAESYSIKAQDTAYFNGNKVPILRPLAYHDLHRENRIYSFFYVEQGMKQLLLFNSFRDSPEGKLPLPVRFGNQQHIARSIGPQNDVVQKEISLHYTDTALQSAERSKTISDNIRIIQRYPYAIALLKQLYVYKTNFRKADLQQQLQYFNKDVKKTTLFKQLNRFLLIYSSTYERAYPESLELENAKGLSQRIGNPNAKMNLLVFWAWWCGPCRKEIPDLKLLHQKYQRRGLSITSISIDSNKAKWQEALEAEKMDWDQLIVSEATLSELQNYFDISAIPKLYLFDERHQLLGKFSGFSAENTTRLQDLLDELQPSASMKITR
ncbi:MAG TPA: TlpA disulfide reductase family protein [Sediminibacterium sp.]|nr:TlpA disulfide reductase family protein [Sediminibacterium sp.]